jgi:hypothetical protein
MWTSAKWTLGLLWEGKILFLDFPSCILTTVQMKICVDSSRKSKNRISLKNIGPTSILQKSSKITRARNQKRPGTNGRGRNQEGEALNCTPSVGIRRWAVCKRDSAHEPPPENVASACDVVGMLDWRRARAQRPRP